MKVKTIKLKMERAMKMYKTKSLVFDLPIQRKANIWDNKRKSKMIHTAILNWPTASLVASKEGRTMNFLDGQQRLTSLISFIEDEYALDKTTPPVNGVEIAGLKFSDLPEEFQQAILNYAFDVTVIEDATIEEMEELFFRLNNGMPLRQIETTRALLGGKVLKLVEDVANTPFFQQKAYLSQKSKLRFLDQELVLQILALIYKPDTGFSGKEIRNFVQELRNERIQEELKSKMQNASFYLNQAFLKKERFLKKLHIPILFKLVLELQEKALPITPRQFEEWARTFFANPPQEYLEACKSGSAKKENVQKRLNSMKAHFEEYFKNVLEDSQKAFEDENTEQDAQNDAKETAS